MILNDPFIAIAVMLIIPAIVVTVMAVILAKRDHTMLAGLGHALGLFLATGSVMSALFGWYINHEQQINPWIEKLIGWGSKWIG